MTELTTLLHNDPQNSTCRHLLKNSEKWVYKGSLGSCTTTQAGNSTGVQQQACEEVAVFIHTVTWSNLQKLWYM